MKPSNSKKKYKFYKAVSLYGSENFYYEILEDNVPIDELDELEIYYIEKYNSWKNGYNSTPGGDGKSLNKIKDVEYIIDRLSKGAIYKELAKELNVCEATIYRALKKYNKTSRKIKYFDKNKLREMYCEGYSYSCIAEEIGIDKRSISKFVNKMGLELRGRGGSKVKVDYSISGDVIVDYLQGMTWDRLRDKYNISRYVLSKIINDYKETQSTISKESRADIDTARSATHLN